MKSIIKLINLHFWKSMLAPFFAFIFPIIFIVILGLLLGYDQLLGGALSIPSMTVGLIAMPQAIFEFKRSVLLKRIGVTKVKPWMFLLAISLYYVGIMLLSTAFCIAMSLAIFSKNWNEGMEMLNNFPIDSNGTLATIVTPTFYQMLQNVNWGEFVWALFMNIFVATSIGLMLVSVLKSSLAIQALGIPILIISQFLSAQVLPIPMVREVDAMYYLSYISPFKYSTGLMINAWQGSVQLNSSDNAVIGLVQIGTNSIGQSIQQVQIMQNSIFNVDSSMYYYYSKQGIDSIKIFDKADKILNLVMPFVWTIIFSGVAIKCFKWNNR